MDAYQLYKVVPELLTFIDDLTNIYIRLNRSRFWAEGMDTDKSAAYSTLFTVLTEFSTCMAPFTPFLAEHIYQALLSFQPQHQETAQSIHLCSYPAANTALINLELEQATALLQQILVLGRQQRNDSKIKTKIPLRSLTIIHKDKSVLAEIKKLENVIKKELNVKEIHYSEDEQKYINLYAKPNSPVLGKRLQKRFGQFKQAIEALNSEQINAFEQQQQMELNGEILNSDDILIFREAKANLGVTSNRFISILLDTELDETLLEEGLAREVINRIQKTRKSLQFNVDDRIHTTIDADDQLQKIIKKHAAYICAETLTLDLHYQPLQGADFNDTIEKHSLALKLERAATP